KRRKRDERQKRAAQRAAELAQAWAEARRVPLDVVQIGRRFLAGDAPDRSCGACTACCTVLNIKTLGKPSGCDCEHLTPGGCGIYPDRPEACREYHCLWRMGWGRPEDRPDRSGVLL